jgi:hypothetical protein
VRKEKVGDLISRGYRTVDKNMSCFPDGMESSYVNNSSCGEVSLMDERARWTFDVCTPRGKLDRKVA